MSSRKKSMRRHSSSKSYSEPSGQTYSTEPQLDEPREPSTSFLFLVNSIGVNEDPNAGGVVPRVDENGYWFPPVYGAGFRGQGSGTVYRWENGIITQATGYYSENSQGYAPNTVALELYRAATMFYCNPFYQFFVADGDASTRDMPNSPVPLDRWYPINFRHHGTISRVDFAGDQPYLAGNGPEFIRQLGLNSYRNRDHDAPASGGLAGNLAILIALIAFSCERSRDLERILLDDRAWRHYEWRGHRRPDGRRDARGLVVSIYYDPDNDDGSTRDALYNLEWNMGALLI